MADSSGPSPLPLPPDTEAAPSSTASQDRIFRSAGIVSVAVGMSRITGLLREVVLARLFGASAAYDAFLLGFRIPNLTRDLFAEGALSSAFVPTFTATLSQQGLNAAVRLANLVACAIVLVVGGLAILGMIFSPQLVGLFATGWTEYPEKYGLTVHLTRIMFPFLLLVALAAQAMGVLNSMNQFGVPAVASAFFNIGSLGFGLFLGFVVGEQIGLAPIEGMAYGVVLGGALQLLWQMPSLWKSGFHFHLSLDWSDPGLRRILRLMGPAILGNAAVQINVLVNTNFASVIEDPIRGPNGPVSWLTYAFRFMQLPLGLFGVALASATLPAISRAAARLDMVDFRQTLARSLAMVFLLTVPSSVGLAVLGPSIVGAIYQGGRFNEYDTSQTALALSFYAIGLSGYAALKVLVPAFYALDDSRTPVAVSLASIGINFAVAWVLVERLGWDHRALALSTSTVALFGFVCLFLLLRQRIGGIDGRALAASMIKIGSASAVMAATAWTSSALIHRLLGPGKPAMFADIAISIPVSAIALWLACRLLGVRELADAERAIARPLLRRLRRL